MDEIFYKPPHIWANKFYIKIYICTNLPLQKLRGNSGYHRTQSQLTSGCTAEGVFRIQHYPMAVSISLLTTKKFLGIFCWQQIDPMVCVWIEWIRMTVFEREAQGESTSSINRAIRIYCQENRLLSLTAK